MQSCRYYRQLFLLCAARFGQMYHLIRKIFVYKVKDRCVCIFLNNMLN